MLLNEDPCKFKPCCFCGYNEKEETPCPKSPDGSHCEHWWDGSMCESFDADEKGDCVFAHKADDIMDACLPYERYQAQRELLGKVVEDLRERRDSYEQGTDIGRYPDVIVGLTVLIKTYEKELQG